MFLEGNRGIPKGQEARGSKKFAYTNGLKGAHIMFMQFE